MSGLLRLYRAGAAIYGWCCTDCHASFYTDRGARREFARLTVHKIVRHRKLPRLVPDRICRITHTTSTGTGSWTYGGSYTITFRNGDVDGAA